LTAATAAAFLVDRADVLAAVVALVAEGQGMVQYLAEVEGWSGGAFICWTRPSKQGAW